MPIYEYVCRECGLKFELIRPLSQADGKAPCPRCHNDAGRTLSAFASFSRNEDGIAKPLGGAGGSCASCGSSNCSTCGM